MQVEAGGWALRRPDCGAWAYTTGVCSPLDKQEHCREPFYDPRSWWSGDIKVSWRSKQSCPTHVGLMADALHSYEHHNINEPAILLGGSFIVDVVEEVAHRKS